MPSLTLPLLLRGALLALPLALACAPCAAQERQRSALRTADGSSLGYREYWTELGQDERRVMRRQVLTVRSEGAPTQQLEAQRIRTERADGSTTSIEERTRLGVIRQQLRADLDAREIRVTRQGAGQVLTAVLPRPEDLRFDNGAGLLAAWDARAQADLQFSVLDLAAPAIETVSYRLLPGTEEGIRRVRRLSHRGSDLRGISYYRIGAAGELLGTEQPMVGSDLRVGPVGEGTSRGRAQVPNIIDTVRYRSPYRIPKRALDKHLRFTLSTTVAFPLAPPPTGEQRVTISPAGVQLDICDGCGPGLANDENFLQEALAPTFWLETAYVPLQRAALKAARRYRRDSDVMEALVRVAIQRMETLDFAGHLSAAETWRYRQGDCTESAALLAALGRAAGIPTKVLSGLVYSRARYHGQSHTFMPHAWVAAFVDGEWRSFDAALDGFDSTHIAFSVGDGDPRSIHAGHQIAALFQTDAMTEVRQRPAEEN